MTDWSKDPNAKVWIEHVLTDMRPKLEESAVVMSLIPDDREGDVKFWVELGASVMLDKPLIAVVFNDAPLPEKLIRVADEIVRCERGVDARASEDLRAAIARVLDM